MTTRWFGFSRNSNTSSSPMAAVALSSSDHVVKASLPQENVPRSLSLSRLWSTVRGRNKSKTDPFRNGNVATAAATPEIHEFPIDTINENAERLAKSQQINYDLALLYYYMAHVFEDLSREDGKVDVSCKKINESLIGLRVTWTSIPFEECETCKCAYVTFRVTNGSRTCQTDDDASSCEIRGEIDSLKHPPEDAVNCPLSGTDILIRIYKACEGFRMDPNHKRELTRLKLVDASTIDLLENLQMRDKNTPKRHAISNQLWRLMRNGKSYYNQFGFMEMNETNQQDFYRQINAFMTDDDVFTQSMLEFEEFVTMVNTVHNLLSKLKLKGFLSKTIEQFEKWKTDVDEYRNNPSRKIPLRTMVFFVEQLIPFLDPIHDYLEGNDKEGQSQLRELSEDIEVYAQVLTTLFQKYFIDNEDRNSHINDFYFKNPVLTFPNPVMKEKVNKFLKTRRRNYYPATKQGGKSLRRCRSHKRKETPWFRSRRCDHHYHHHCPPTSPAMTNAKTKTTSRTNPLQNIRKKKETKAQKQNKKAGIFSNQRRCVMSSWTFDEFSTDTFHRIGKQMIPSVNTAPDISPVFTLSKPTTSTTPTPLLLPLPSRIPKTSQLHRRRRVRVWTSCSFCDLVLSSPYFPLLSFVSWLQNLVLQTSYTSWFSSSLRFVYLFLP